MRDRKAQEMPVTEAEEALTLLHSNPHKNLCPDLHFPPPALCSNCSNAIIDRKKVVVVEEDMDGATSHADDGQSWDSPFVRGLRVRKWTKSDPMP